MTLFRSALGGLLVLAGLTLIPSVAVASGPAAAQARPRPSCHGVPATIVGTDRSERIVGTRRADVIVGLGGSDTILAGGGDDVVCGGSDADILFGGSGADQLDSGDGDDRAMGRAGNDRIRVNEDGGRFYGGPGNDRFDAAATGPEGATLAGGEGTDQLVVFPFYESEETVAITADYRVGTVTTDRSGYELAVSGIETTRFRDWTASGSDTVVTAYFYGTESRDAVWSRVELHAWTYGGQDQLMAVYFDDELDGGADYDSAHGGGGDDTCLNIEDARDCD